MFALLFFKMPSLKSYETLQAVVVPTGSSDLSRFLKTVLGYPPNDVVRLGRDAEAPVVMTATLYRQLCEQLQAGTRDRVAGLPSSPVDAEDRPPSSW